MRHSLRALLLRGARDEGGAVAVVFAICMIVIFMLILGTADVYLSQGQRSRVQDALDAAALHAARSSAQTDAAINTIGQRVLLSNLVLVRGTSLVASEFHLDRERVVASAEVTPSTFAAALWPHQNIRVNSEVVRSMDRLEIALVFDNTGSMAGTKLTTLQSAGQTLVDKLSAAAARSTDPTPIRIALVPFSTTVRVSPNVSLSGYNTATHTGTGVPSWIDPQGKAHNAAGTQYETFSVANTDRLSVIKSLNNNVPWAGCVENRRQPYDIQETAPNPAVAATMFTPYFWPDEPDSGTGYNNNYLPDVTSSTNWKTRETYQPKYAGKSLPGGTNSLGYVYGPNSGCSLQPLIRLTSNMASIKSSIAAMTAVGETNITLGLMWGWHTLSPNAPFADGQPYATQHLRKIVILMTDGDNTMSDPSGTEQNTSYYGGNGYIWQNMLGMTSGTQAQRVAAMDARTAQLCTNMKAQNIVLYTVRVEVTSGSSALLQNCASTPDKFYDVQNVAQLGAVFDAIAGSIDNLRIVK